MKARPEPHLTRTHIVDALAKESPLTRVEIVAVVGAFVDAILDGILAGQTVEIAGIGTFYPRMAPRAGAGRPMRILSFRPAIRAVEGRSVRVERGSVAARMDAAKAKSARDTRRERAKKAATKAAEEVRQARVRAECVARAEADWKARKVAKEAQDPP